MIPIPCQVYSVLAQIMQIYLVMLVVYAVIGWIPSLRGRWSEYLAMAIDPVLVPLRRVIPPLGGFDLSFLVLFIVVQWIGRSIVPASCYFLR